MNLKMKLIGLALIGLLVVGCARVSYKDGELNYSRWGKQQLEGFELEKDNAGMLKVKFIKQEGGEAIAEIVKVLADKIPVPPVIP